MSRLVKELTFTRLVSQDTSASALGILSAVMLITAGIMWAKAGTATGLSCVGIAALLAVVVLWRTSTVRTGVMRAVPLQARVTRNRVEPLKHGRSIRRLHYEFDLAGRVFIGNAITSTYGRHEARVVGEPVLILVDPKRPSRTWLIEQFVPDVV